MIRLQSIELHNFKNTKYGKAALSNLDVIANNVTSDIIGFYGQNGSGKTSIIDAISVLSVLMLGDSLSEKVSEFIHESSNSLLIKVSFLLDETPVELQPSLIVNYVVEIARDDVNGVSVTREELSCKTIEPKSIRRTLVKYSRTAKEDASSFVFLPRAHWNALMSFQKDYKLKLAVEKELAIKERRSLIWSKTLLKMMAELALAIKDQDGKSAVSKALNRAYEEIFVPFFSIAVMVKKFTNQNLAVVFAARQAASNFNLLPISISAKKQEDPTNDTLLLNINDPVQLNFSELETLQYTLDSINIVLGALVPELQLRLHDLNDIVDDDGSVKKRIMVLAERPAGAIPLRCESEGIKKIVCLLALFIEVYNDENACVVVDELDAGIYEFLLGEILEVLVNQGKGQLIFTAHNLRPLEVLPSDSIVFTTINPENRYMRFTNIKRSNNLRDVYLRAINLGGRGEEVYIPTSRYMIDDALYEAGRSLEAIATDDAPPVLSDANESLDVTVNI